MKNVLNAVTAILVILFFGWQFYVTSCKEEFVPNESVSEVTETVIECSETDDSRELDLDTTQIDSLTILGELTFTEYLDDFCKKYGLTVSECDLLKDSTLTEE